MTFKDPNHLHLGIWFQDFWLRLRSKKNADLVTNHHPTKGRLSHENKPRILSILYIITGWLIGILTMVVRIPYITG